jgi:hypothetical protein
MHHVLTWPVGRNEISKRRAPLAPLAAYATASTLAAAAIGLAVGLLGAPARANPALATALVVAGLLVIAVAAVSEARGTMRPFAQPRRQVPRRWLLWRHRTLTAAAFGAMIGSGVLTYTEHAVAYGLGVALLLSPSVSTAVVLGGLYGLARGAPAVITWSCDRWGVARPGWEKLAQDPREVRLVLAVTVVGAGLMVGVSI